MKDGKKYQQHVRKELYALPKQAVCHNKPRNHFLLIFADTLASLLRRYFSGTNKVALVFTS